jgi:hypothetical protein
MSVRRDIWVAISSASDAWRACARRRQLLVHNYLERLLVYIVGTMGLQRGLQGSRLARHHSTTTLNTYISTRVWILVDFKDCDHRQPPHLARHPREFRERSHSAKAVHERVRDARLDECLAQALRLSGVGGWPTVAGHGRADAAHQVGPGWVTGPVSRIRFGYRAQRGGKSERNAPSGLPLPPV